MATDGALAMQEPHSGSGSDGLEGTMPEAQEEQFDAATIYSLVKPRGTEAELQGQPQQLLPQLRPYQRRAAQWMLDRELQQTLVQPLRCVLMCTADQLCCNCHVEEIRTIPGIFRAYPGGHGVRVIPKKVRRAFRTARQLIGLRP